MMMREGIWFLRNISVGRIVESAVFNFFICSRERERERKREMLKRSRHDARGSKCTSVEGQSLLNVAAVMMRRWANGLGMEGGRKWRSKELEIMAWLWLNLFIQEVYIKCESKRLFSVPCGKCKMI